MRIPPRGDVMNALGVSVQVIPRRGYTALEKNTIVRVSGSAPTMTKNSDSTKWRTSTTRLVGTRSVSQLLGQSRSVGGAAQLLPSGVSAACKSAQTMQTRYDAQNPPALNEYWHGTTMAFSRLLMRRRTKPPKPAEYLCRQGSGIRRTIRSLECLSPVQL